MTLPRFRTALCSFLLASVVAACLPAETTWYDAVPESDVLYFEPIARGQQATLQDSTEIAIRDAETWETYRRQLRTQGAISEVDFSQTFVLLVALPMPSGGYLVDFESVEELDGTIIASYLVTLPGDDCMTAMGRTVPFQAVMVRLADGELRFQRRVERVPCTFK
jgi:hypothetical protein